LLNRRGFRAAGFAAAFTIVAYSVSLAVALNGNAESVHVLSEPKITATASRDSGRPRDLVKISFVANSGLIQSCNAQFDDSSLVFCNSGAGSVDLYVPDSAVPGTTSIRWTATPKPDIGSNGETATGNEPCCGGGGGGGGTDGLPAESGIITFTVLPPIGQVSPSASPPDGGGGGPVNPPGGTVGSPSTGGERQSPGTPASGDAGTPATQPNTVPRSGSSPLLIGIPLIVVLLVAAAIAVALIARRVRARSAAQIRGRSKQPSADPRVRAVAHADPYVQVTAEETRKGRAHVVRLEPHSSIADVYVQEVGK
jgi:hypothetical protein